MTVVLEGYGPTFLISASGLDILRPKLANFVTISGLAEKRLSPRFENAFSNQSAAANGQRRRDVTTYSQYLRSVL